MTTTPHPSIQIFADQAALAEKEKAAYDSCENAVETSGDRPQTHEGTQARSRAYRSGRLRSEKQEARRLEKLEAAEKIAADQKAHDERVAAASRIAAAAPAAVTPEPDVVPDDVDDADAETPSADADAELLD